MKAARSTRPRHVGFRITAMIDMAFLLITFFIMSIRFGHQGEELVKLPDADQAREVTDERVELVTVNITRSGKYMIGGTLHSGDEVLAYLQARQEEGDKVEVVIRGDKGSEFNAVQRVMRMSAEAGISNVSLAALQRDPDKAELE
ncbi:MAG: biopolymer transporter ExbD [Myxococcales bacterium]|nr:MAG: biopolymer transporter ExbD [Myxococcales bacterium]